MVVALLFKFSLVQWLELEEDKDWDEEESRGQYCEDHSKKDVKTVWREEVNYFLTGLSPLFAAAKDCLYGGCQECVHDW